MGNAAVPMTGAPPPMEGMLTGGRTLAVDKCDSPETGTDGNGVDTPAP